MTLTQIKPAGISKPVDLADNEKIRLGTGNDLEIYHNGTANYIKGVNNQFIYLGTNNTNRWSIANDGHIRPEANQTYDIGSSVQQVNQVYAKEFIVRDDGYLKAGNSADLQIYHNGTSSYISNTTGNLYITATSTETAIQIIPNGATDLRYDGSKKLETTASGVDVTGYLKASTYLWTDTALYSDQWISKSTTNGHYMYIYARDAAGNLAKQAQFQISQGATFYHNTYKTLETVDGGIRVYGKEGGSGHVYIQADEGDDNADNWVLRAANGSSELKIRNSASGYWEESIVMDGNGAVELYYDNAKKLETKSTGVAVTGNLSANISASIGTTGLQAGHVLSVVGSNNNQINIARSANNSWGLLLTNSQPSSGYHATTNSSVGQPCAIVNVQSDALHFGTGNNVRWTIDHSGEFYPATDGAVDIGKDNFRVRTVHASNITFGGDTAAANKLDDYEEGTFTPRLGPHNNHSIYENGTGKYTKIGNSITYTMSWQDKDCTAFPTNSRIEIWNLPFTFQQQVAGEHQVMPSLMMHNVQFANNEKHYFYTINNGSNMYGLKSRDGTSWIEWAATDWDQDDVYFDATGSFFVN